MEFEIDNLEDVIKEALKTILSSDNETEINEIYNRDIKKIWNELIVENELTESEKAVKERVVLYMPRKKMVEYIRRIYGI
jgi:hypothetical protein